MPPPCLQAAPHGGEGRCTLVPSHPLTGVVDGPETWSRRSVPLSPSQGPAYWTLPVQRPSQSCPSRLPASGALSHPSLANEDDLLPAQDKDTDLVSKRTFISKIEATETEIPPP